MISEELLESELDRIQYDFEEIDVPVKCLQTVQEFDIGNRKIKLIKGLKMKIPFWLALLLEKEELVEIEEEERIDFPYLFKLSKEESSNRDLQKITPFLYIQVKHLFDEFVKQGKTLPYRQRESMEMKLRELMTKRLSKILKIAEKGKNITAMTRNMTPEEKWLNDTVTTFVDKWKDMVKASDDEFE